jgi:hypothetical protein
VPIVLTLLPHRVAPTQPRDREATDDQLRSGASGAGAGSRRASKRGGCHSPRNERSTLTVPAKSLNIKYVESAPISAGRVFRPRFAQMPQFAAVVSITGFKVGVFTQFRRLSGSNLSALALLDDTGKT